MIKSQIFKVNDIKTPENKQAASKQCNVTISLSGVAINRDRGHHKWCPFRD
jgi:hypothetical protein